MTATKKLQRKGRHRTGQERCADQNVTFQLVRNLPFDIFTNTEIGFDFDLGNTSRTRPLPLVLTFDFSSRSSNNPATDDFFMMMITSMT